MPRARCPSRAIEVAVGLPATGVELQPAVRLALLERALGDALGILVPASRPTSVGSTRVSTSSTIDACVSDVKAGKGASLAVADESVVRGDPDDHVRRRRSIRCPEAEHLLERGGERRHGLIILIALGESIISIGVGAGLELVAGVIANDGRRRRPPPVP